MTVLETTTQDGQKTMVIDDLTIFSPIFEDVFGREIKRFLEGHVSFPSIDFNDTWALYDGKLGFYIVEYASEDQREVDRVILEKHFAMDTKFTSKVLDGNRQLPEMSGYFDYNGKYYLVMYAYNKHTEETDKDKGVYKGIYVNPQKFCEDHGLDLPGSSVEEVVEQTELDLVDNLDK